MGHRGIKLDSGAISPVAPELPVVRLFLQRDRMTTLLVLIRQDSHLGKKRSANSVRSGGLSSVGNWADV